MCEQFGLSKCIRMDHCIEYQYDYFIFHLTFFCYIVICNL